MTKRQIIKGLFDYFLQTPEKKWIAVERRWEKITYLSGLLVVWVSGAMTGALGIVLLLFSVILFILGIWYMSLKR